MPGSGRITVSKRVGGITAGTWEAAAAPVPVAGLSGSVQPGFTSTSGASGWAPAVQVIASGVRLGAWPGLVVLGAVVAVALLLVLVARAGRPVGTLLDATAPGLTFGQATGRVGRFLGGCYVGRPVRRGLWSSDRRVGMRRIPTRLFESAGAMSIGGVAPVAVLVSLRPGGVVFVGTIAAYTLLRQFLFPLRDLPRNPSWGRTATAVASALVTVGVIAVAVVG